MSAIRLNISQPISACILSLLLTSCSGKHPAPVTGDNKIIPRDTVSLIYKKPSSASNDTLLIDGKSAVFYNPDSQQLRKIKAISKKTVFESDVHDCFYQMRNARLILKKYWPRIRIIETSGVRFLLFKKIGTLSTCIDLDSRNEMCGIYLFDPVKDPQFIDMMNIDTELGFYFSR